MSQETTDKRKSVIFKTKRGTEFELKEYLTGREKRQVKNALWTGKSMQIRDGKGESDPVEMDKMDASTDKTIELMVLSVNGDSKNVLDVVLDLPSNDYDELLEKIEEITGAITEEKKETGSSDTKS